MTTPKGGNNEAQDPAHEAPPPDSGRIPEDTEGAVRVIRGGLAARIELAPELQAALDAAAQERAESIGAALSAAEVQFKGAARVVAKLAGIDLATHTVEYAPDGQAAHFIKQQRPAR